MCGIRPLEFVMTSLPDQKLDVVRQLVQQAPDRVVGGLQAALTDAGDGRLSEVRRLVELEAADRRLRNFVLSPVAPLFRAGRRGLGVLLPPRALSLLWRGLKSDAPGETGRLDSLLRSIRADEQEQAFEPADALMARLAAGFRAGARPEYVEAAGLVAEARPGGIETLSLGLELSPIIRAAGPKLPDWVMRSTGENAAAARLAYRDAVSRSDEAGPLFFEMLAGQLDEPWMIMRIISAVMDRPGERYAAGSEVAAFPVRILEMIEENLEAIAGFAAEAGPAAGREAGRSVERIVSLAAELEDAVQLARDGPWGQRLAQHRKTLAATVERRLRETVKLVAAALPTERPSFGRGQREAPRLAGGPDGEAVAKAMTLLAFVDEIRSSADHGGFGASRTRLVEHLGDELDHYVEDVLDRIRHDEVDDEAAARAYLEAVAGFAALLRDEKAGEIIRRRAAAA